MSPLVSLLELTILAACAALLLRRSEPARPPFDAKLARVALALVVQSILPWLVPEAASTTAWVVEGTRALLLVGAVAAWTSIVRAVPRIGRRFLWIAVASALVALGATPLKLAGWIALFVVVARLDWPREVPGLRRAVGLALSLPIAALTAIEPTSVGDGPASLFSHVVRLALPLFQVQLVVAFFRFLFLPVGLRTLPLARRFAVNHALTRSVPALFSTVTLTAVVVLGYGLHKATDARQAMEQTLDRASAAALVLADGAPFGEAAARARLALGEDAEGAAIVRRGSAPEADAPESIVAHAAFEGDPSAEEGLLLVDGRLYLVARKGVAEIWVPLDGTWLSRYAARALVEVEIREMPGVRLGTFTVAFGEAPETEGAVTVRTAGFASPGISLGDFLRYRFPLSRLFLPIGDWRDTAEEGRRGVAGMTVRGSIAQALSALKRNPYLVASNAVPFLLLGALGMVIGLVEGLAVRTGRSIVQAVVDDVRTLEAGARRIGAGDLDHRVPVPGRDELSSLAGALNTMAADLKRQQAALVEKERLEADLEVARSIQQRLLPQGAPAVAGIDVAGVSIPSRVVGGDLFYFLPFGEGSLGLAVGDVSGKSVPAAFLMSNVVAVLRAEAQIGVDVDESLSRINRLLAEQVEPNRFVTLFYGIVDRASDSMRYACAGHEPALIVRADGTIVWLREGGTPLGILADRSYRATSERFATGDVLVLYSDGLTEAESESGEFFGNARLAAAVASFRQRSATEILEAVLAAVREFTGGRPLSDDRTLVVVRAGGGLPGTEPHIRGSAP